MGYLLMLVLASAGPHGAAMARIPPAASPATAEQMLASDSRQVRGVSAHVAALLADGVRRSDTFGRLVSAIHGTRVIVYVEATFNLPPGIGGRLILQGATEAARYLRVQVLATLRPDQMISTIAHELQHALEVAADDSVIDTVSLAGLYRRIGVRSTVVADGYDTIEAMATGEIVRNELSGRRRTPRSAAPALETADDATI